jgi:dihydrofolate synthase/folylpolyglutamate synthase
MTASVSLMIIWSETEEVPCASFCCLFVVWADRSKPLADGWAIAEASNFKYRSPLLKGLSEYQLENSGLAMAAVHLLREKGFKLSDEAILKGFENTKWPGRVQWVRVPQLGNYSILVDGAHNTGGAAQLRKYIDHHRHTHSAIRKVIFLFGASASKDVKGILRLLLRPGDELFALPFSTPERMPWIHCYKVTDIANIVASLVPSVSCLTFDSLESAFAHLNEHRLQGGKDGQSLQQNHINVKFSPNELLIVLCGSLYLLADFYRSLGDSARPYLWEDFDPMFRQL